MQVDSFQRFEYSKSGSLCEPFSCILLPVLVQFTIFQSLLPDTSQSQKNILYGALIFLFLPLTFSKTFYIPINEQVRDFA